MASTVNILIKAKDEASKEIDKVKKSLDGMGKDGGESAENLGLDFDSLVGVITAGAAIAAAAAAAFKVALDFSEEGAGIKRLQDTSAMLASSMGFDMDEIVAKVSAASLNTVSDMDIMSSAAKAMMLGVGSSAEELASLMEVAAIRGRALGMDATEAFDQIVRGIGRLSPKILDNLGIIVDADVTYAAYAKSIGKTADELTEVEKRQALVNAVIADTAPLLAESGGLTEDSAAAWEQMSAAQKNFWDNLKADAADLMSWWPKFWADFYSNMNASRDIPELRQQLNDLMQSLLELKQVTPEEYQSVMKLAYAHREAGETVEVLNELLDMYGDAAEGATTATDNATWSVDAYGNAALEAGSEVEVFGSNSKRSAEEVDAMRIAAQETQKQIEDLQKALEGANLELDVAIRTFSESIGGDLAQGLKDAGLEGDELLNRLGLIDQAFGTSYVLEYKLELATDDLLDTLINDPDNFLPDAQQFLDYFTPLQDSVIEAMGKVDELEAQLSELERTWNIRVKITTEGGFPGGTTFTPPHSIGQFPEAAGGSIHAAASGLAASLPYYWVGERGPEPFFPSVDGRIVSNTQAMAALRGGTNAREIANAVKQGVKEAMRDTGGGKIYNLTMPTSSNPADVRTAFELMEAWA